MFFAHPPPDIVAESPEPELSDFYHGIHLFSGAVRCCHYFLPVNFRSRGYSPSLNGESSPLRSEQYATAPAESGIACFVSSYAVVCVLVIIHHIERCWSDSSICRTSVSNAQLQTRSVLRLSFGLCF